MDLNLNSLINIASGKSDLVIATQVLKKAQDISATTATQLINAIPKPPPSPQGVGQGLDVYA